MTHSGRASTGISAEPELVEIGYFIALTMGQQRWLRTLDIEHHQNSSRHRRLDGAWLRDRRGAANIKSGRGLLD